MRNFFLSALVFFYSPWVQAGLSTLFKDEEGRTNWQHLANWVSGTLIIILTIVIIFLVRASRRAYKANQALKAIRDELEVRVEERTATLNDSNKKLQQEIDEHIVTTNRLGVSESYIRDILTSMPLMLIGLDKDGRVTQWNKRVEDFSGIAESAALGKMLWDVYPTITIAPEQVQQCMATNSAIHIKQSLRSLSHYDINIFPLKSQQEPGVVILVDDVSKQTAAENMLIHNDKLSFMGELASTMAHDINRPLQDILLDLKSFQNILQLSAQASSSDIPDEYSDRINTILADMSGKGDQVSSIINNLISFARSRHENKQKTNVIEVMDHSIELANDVIALPNLDFSRITLEKNIEDNLPEAPCYITEFQQVLLSLFRHSAVSLAQKLEKDPDFKPVIKVLMSENYGSLWVKVQHNGVGLTNDEQMYLFEPFFSNTNPKDSVDAGQRLSFSYYIITEQHEGHMAVTSDVNVGSTFHIQIPL